MWVGSKKLDQKAIELDNNYAAAYPVRVLGSEFDVSKTHWFWDCFFKHRTPHVYIVLRKNVSHSVPGVFSFQKILSGECGRREEMSAEGVEIVDVDPDNPRNLELEHKNAYTLCKCLQM